MQKNQTKGRAKISRSEINHNHGKTGDMRGGFSEHIYPQLRCFSQKHLN